LTLAGSGLIKAKRIEERTSTAATEKHIAEARRVHRESF
jgi:hypothetical protein